MSWGGFPQRCSMGAAGRQKVWSSTWSSNGLLPYEGYGLAGPIRRRKHSGIGTPDLDPKAPYLLPASKGLDENQVGCPGGRSVGSRARSLLRSGTQGTVPREGLQSGSGLGLPAPPGWAPGTQPSQGRRVEAVVGAFCHMPG